MAVRGRSVPAGDPHHVGIPPGDEIDGALPQRLQCCVAYDWVDQCRAEWVWRAVEDRLQRLTHCAASMAKNRVFIPFWFSYSDPCLAAGGSGRGPGAGGGRGWGGRAPPPRPG